MTKRILALLLAVVFAFSCCLLCACGDEKTNDGKGDQAGDNTNNKDDDKTPADNNNNNDNKPADDDKPDNNTDNDEPSEPADDVDPAAEFDGEELPFEFFSTNWEAWTGSGYVWWQAVVGLDKSNEWLTANYGTPDYAYNWTMNVRPAEAGQDDDKSNDVWWSVPCQLDTSSGAGDNFLFRLQTGTGFDGKFTVGNDYEVVLTIEGPEDAKYKSMTMYFTWSEKYQSDYDNWKAGKDTNGGTETPCFIPEIPPHEGMTPTQRPKF